MSSQKYTREYLTNLPIQMRKQAVQQQSSEKIQFILSEARNGKTSCIVSIPEAPALGRGINMGNSTFQIPPSKEELIELLVETFPDCKITYEEKWVETSPGRKELKKGIEVNWA